jgi:hypothetical protein
MTSARSSSIGLDIGGANLKVYSEHGWEILYFPFWKEWERLSEVLAEIKDKYGVNRAGAVITAELSDAFPSKAEALLYIEKTLKNIFDEVFFLDLNGELKRNMDNPLSYAASNWVASVKFLSADFDEFIFADMGSTTTDIIPFKGRILAGRTDYERLKRKELLYFGMLRTPVFYILSEFDGVSLSSEYFSITADVMQILGLIDSSAYTCETPDGRGNSIDECMQRLARSLCCDVEELGRENTVRLAEAVKERMVDKVASTFREKSEEHGISLVLGCGIGEALLKEAAEMARLEYMAISGIYGEASHLFPAFAMWKLVDGLVDEVMNEPVDEQ